jgi:lipopolysaccharide/colanic/teichoic acid biosynthesis glycosyltransferase
MSSIFKKQFFSSSIIPADFVTKGLPRSLEWIMAITGIVVLLPILLLCAQLVWFSSPGGVFFRQRRVGRNGKTFTLYKFRTMFVSNGGSLVTSATDYRITPVGRFLRNWKLDELPELYNVLRGEMSFVGPRPEVPELVDFSNPAWSVILKVRPGITDTVTLRLRNEESILATVEDKESFYREVVQPYKIDGYMEYLKIKSLKTDLIIIAQTLKVILFPRTAPPLPSEKIGISNIE